MRQPLLQSSAIQSKALDQLASEIDAYRRGRPRRRLSPELRARVVAVLDAGASVRAVRETCKLSGWQVTRWRRAAAARNAEDAQTRDTACASPRVLSVVDDPPGHDVQHDSEIELRIGGWHVTVRREVP